MARNPDYAGIHASLERLYSVSPTYSDHERRQHVNPNRKALEALLVQIINVPNLAGGAQADHAALNQLLNDPVAGDQRRKLLGVGTIAGVGPANLPAGEAAIQRSAALYAYAMMKLSALNPADQTHQAILQEFYALPDKTPADTDQAHTTKFNDFLKKHQSVLLPPGFDLAAQATRFDPAQNHFFNATRAPAPGQSDRAKHAFMKAKVYDLIGDDKKLLLKLAATNNTPADFKAALEPIISNAYFQGGAVPQSVLDAVIPDQQAVDALQHEVKIRAAMLLIASGDMGAHFDAAGQLVRNDPGAKTLLGCVIRQGAAGVQLVIQARANPAHAAGPESQGYGALQNMPALSLTDLERLKDCAFDQFFGTYYRSNPPAGLNPQDHVVLQALRDLKHITSQTPAVPVAQIRHVLGMDEPVLFPHPGPDVVDGHHGQLPLPAVKKLLGLGAGMDDAEVKAFVGALSDDQIQRLCIGLSDVLKRAEHNIQQAGDFTQMSSQDLGQALTLPEPIAKEMGWYFLPSQLTDYRDNTKSAYHQALFTNAVPPVQSVLDRTPTYVPANPDLMSQMQETALQFEDLKQLFVDAVQQDKTYDDTTPVTLQNKQNAKHAQHVTEYTLATVDALLTDINTKITDTATSVKQKAKLQVVRDDLLLQKNFFEAAREHYVTKAQSMDRSLGGGRLPRPIAHMDKHPIKIRHDVANHAFHEATRRSESQWTSLLVGATKLDADGNVKYGLSNVPNFAADAASFTAAVQGIDTKSPSSQISDVSQPKTTQGASGSTVTAFDVTTKKEGAVTLTHDTGPTGSGQGSINAKGDSKAVALVLAEAYKASLLNQGLITVNPTSGLPEPTTKDPHIKIHFTDAKIDLKRPDGSALPPKKMKEVRGELDKAFGKVFGKLYNPIGGADTVDASIATYSSAGSARQGQHMWRQQGAAGATQAGADPFPTYTRSPGITVH